jgi:catecholate siderophore receptor
VFDTLKLQERWLLGLGARYEHDRARYQSWTATPAASLTTPPGSLSAGNVLVNDNDLFSYRATLLYKPVEAGSLYVAFGNSRIPSTATVNGSCTTNCNVAPENDVNYELGTKWDLLRDQLAVTAAVFRTDRRNYLVASGDPAVPQQQLDGKARVDGEQIGLAGNLTRQWAIFANYAHLRSEVLQSVSNHTLALTGIDAQKGNPLANTPGNSANLWTTYRFSHALTLGYGVNYTSWVWATANNATPTAPYNRATLPGFVVHNLMGSYELKRHFTLQLNVTNLFDKEYFTQLRTVSTTSGWVYPGTGRTAILTGSLSF